MTWHDSEDDREREKLSWREKDALKNKSRHLPKEESPKRPQNHKKREESAAKKALDDLFVPKKSKEAENEWEKMARLTGKEFREASAAFVEKFGIPKVWDDLIRLLDHDDPDFLLKILNQIEVRHTEENKTSLDVCVGKLKILALTQEHPDLLKKIQTLIDVLSARI